MGSVFFNLSADDKEKISQIRRQFSAKEQLAMDTDAWLEPWVQAKDQYLNKIFDTDLILHKPIDYKMSDTELAEKISEELFNNFRLYGNPKLSLIQQTAKEWRDQFYRLLIENTLSSNERVVLMQLIDTFSLGTNTYKGKSIDFVIPENGKKIKIQDGCKVSKIIGQLCREIGIYNLWEPIRLKISQIRNTNKLSGILHLSIHPIDFFTSSNNDYDWNSCMEFGEGDYCRGVIEMMNSPMVIQAYLTGAEENFDFTQTVSWYNKKWREFFLITPTMISGIKGYPYWNQDLEKIVITWICSLLKEKKIWTDKFWGPITEYAINEPISGLPNQTIHNIYCGPAMYDDFYTGETYQATFATNFNASHKIFYSGLSECLNCGADCEDHEAFSLLCRRCDSRVLCSGCGSYISRDDDTYEINGQYYCSYCYNEMDFCSNCNLPLTSYDYGINIHLAQYSDDNNIIRFPTSFLLCSDCISSLLKPNTSYHEAYHTSPHNITTYYNIIFLHDIKEEFFDDKRQNILLESTAYPTDPSEYTYSVKLTDNI